MLRVLSRWLLSYSACFSLCASRCSFEICYDLRHASLASAFHASISEKLSVSTWLLGPWAALRPLLFALDRLSARRRFVSSSYCTDSELAFDFCL
jgi:hypothetical protein